jgi:hypothetical protein
MEFFAFTKARRGRTKNANRGLEKREGKTIVRRRKT